MPAIWFRFRAELRERWRGWLGLAVLAGVAAGGVMALAGGARRTDSAYPRFLEAQNAAHVLVVNERNNEDDTAEFDFDEIASLPQVAESAQGGFGFVAIGSGVISHTPLDDSLGRDLNRIEVIEGRLPDPDRPEEVALSPTVAEIDDVHVGDTVDQVEPALLATGIPEDLSVLPPSDQTLVRQVVNLEPDNKLRVVGIAVAPGTFPPQRRAACCVFHSAAFGEVGTPGQVLAVRLEDSATVAEFRDELEARSGGLQVNASDLVAQADEVQQSIEVQVVGLWLMAGLGAAVAVLVAGQLLVRLALLEAHDNQTLNALGTTRRQRTVLGLVRAGVIGVAAALVALTIAVALSPLFPVGLARTAEPDSGVTFDVTVLAVGAAVTVAAILALSAVPAWIAARRLAPDADTARRVPRVAQWLGRTGAPLTVVTGARMATSRGAGRTAVPLASSLGAIALGLGVLVGALTFTASLQHLLATPRLYGLGWDVQFTSYGEPVGELLAPIATDRDDVDGVAIGATNLPAEIGGRRVDVIGLDPVEGDVLPPAVAGRQPTGTDEIALGSRTLGDVGVGIGDVIDVEALDGSPQSFTIVGRTVLPDSSDESRLGRGAVVSVAGYARLAGLPPEGAAQDLFVDLAPGSDPQQVAVELGDAACEVVQDPEGCILYPIEYGPPTDIVNFGRAEAFPIAVGSVLAALAAATLAHVVVTSVRRRRRDLALLKTFGFTRRDLALTVAVAATAAVIVGLLVGVPLGVAAGRWLWTLRAEDLGLVVEPRVPVRAIVGVAISAVVLANLIALLPGRSAARSKPAEILRTE